MYDIARPKEFKKEKGIRWWWVPPPPQKASSTTTVVKPSKSPGALFSLPPPLRSAWMESPLLEVVPIHYSFRLTIAPLSLKLQDGREGIIGGGGGRDPKISPVAPTETMDEFLRWEEGERERGGRRERKE